MNMLSGMENLRAQRFFLQGNILSCVIPGLKYEIDQNHVAGGSGGHGQHHIPLPQVDQNGDGDGNELRKAVPLKRSSIARP